MGTLLLPNLLVLLAGGLLGIAAHLIIFIRGEWHVQAPKLAVGHALVFLCVALCRSFLRDSLRLYPLLDGLMLASLIYLAGLLTSISIYRISVFHRLTAAGFPGPFGARVSKLWHVWACRYSKNHELLDRLHQEYGDFVRTGPSEITIYLPEVFMAIDGPHSECIKSEWYDILHPNMALVTTRDKATHAARRRQWNRGFSSRALKLHEAKILRHVDRLDRRIKIDVDQGKPSNAKNLMYWFGFDAMGDFVFNYHFGMLETTTWHHFLVRSYRAVDLLGPFGPVPWLVHIAFKLLPRVNKLRDWYEMTSWCRQIMDQRLKNDALQKELDLTHYLMMQDPKQGKVAAGEEVYATARKHNRFWIHGDSLLVMVAGSGPIATALTFLLGELAQNPRHIDKLYEELRGVDTTDLDALSKLPHLDACLVETLRLWPGLLTGGARKTGKNGAWVAGRFIPPETTIVAPQYVIARREDCFIRARKFIPERWTSSPELVLNAGASTPFGTGASSCVGRVLANDVVKCTAARLVRKYNFSLAPGEDARGVSSEVRDTFLPRPGDLNLCFKLRGEEKADTI
ncbi:Tryprostatin B 6-hydroxylase [Cytospora mali]|uniref:Tryprostatin B 6-hydroxylase n=1 Tax=Cytospora mali TaxID=578113 RepID=A0A194VW30_CYTMA|nr:Tryprostatin B 6-hydroxylase [Valsa mali]